MYTYEFYKEWGTSRLQVGNKIVKDYGCLTSSKYAKKRDSFKDVKKVKFKKNSYGYVAPKLESKENKHAYKNYTYFTGYMVDDVYSNVYKQSKKTKRITMVKHDAHIIDVKGKYLLAADNHGDYSPEMISVINMATGKVKKLSMNVIANTFPKIYGTHLYYPEYVNSNDYLKKEFQFVVKRYVLGTGKKKTLTKKIKCNKVISFSNKYVRYKKGSAEYMYYYSNGKVKKLGQKNNNTTNNNHNNNNSNNNNSNNSNTVTVQPSIRISGGYTGSGSCTLSATTVPGNLYVSWSSSNPSVATVSGGKVTAKAGGTTRITASINYGGRTYSASKNVTVGTNKSYGAWSGWTIDPIAATASREVRTTALYHYYYFYCPVCGGREPLQGISDCHSYTLTLSNGNVGWFPIPYSQCASAPYSYASYKRYTTSLGDGGIWNFSTGNLYHTAIGTKDTDSGAEVIKVGYSYRNVSTWSYIQRIN